MPLIYVLFLESSSIINGNVWLKLTLAYLELNRNDCGKNALITLYSVNKQKATIQQRVTHTKLIIQVKEKINTFYERGEDGVLDMKNFVDYQQTCNHLNTLIARNTDDFVQFWKYFKQPEMVLKDLLALSIEIEKKSIEIQKLWETFIKRHPKFSLSRYPLYSNYLATVRNSFYKAEKVMTTYHENLNNRIQHENAILTQENLQDNKNIIIYVSMKK